MNGLSSKTVKKYINKAEEIVITGGWRGLERLGYQHYQLNDFRNFKDSDRGVHTNFIERTWSAIKQKQKKVLKGKLYNLFGDKRMRLICGLSLFMQ
jgi:hypothetical protein